MGMYATADVMWGIDFGEELPEAFKKSGEDSEEDDDDDTDLEEALAFLLAGVEPPTVGYSDAVEPEYRAYWDKKHAALAEAGVEVRCYGHHADETYYALIVTFSHELVSVGECFAFDSLKHESEWEDKLRVACEKLNIAYEPKWLVAVSFG